MGVAIQRWVADDGTEFNTEQEMILHELSILDAKEIDVFLQHVVDTRPRKLNEYRKLLVSWQAYLQSQKYPKNPGPPSQSKPVEANVTTPIDVGIATQIDAKIDAELEAMLQPSPEDTDVEETTDWPDGLEAVPLRVHG